MADGSREPQSWQSVPALHMPYSAPGPPSSQAPSLGQLQASMHWCPVSPGGGAGGKGGCMWGELMDDSVWISDDFHWIWVDLLHIDLHLFAEFYTFGI